MPWWTAWWKQWRSRADWTLPGRRLLLLVLCLAVCAGLAAALGGGLAALLAVLLLCVAVASAAVIDRTALRSAPVPVLGRKLEKRLQLGVVQRVCIDVDGQPTLPATVGVQADLRRPGVWRIGSWWVDDGLPVDWLRIRRAGGARRCGREPTVDCRGAADAARAGAGASGRRALDQPVAALATPVRGWRRDGSVASAAGI